MSRSYFLPSVVRLNVYVRCAKRFGTARCTRRNILLRDRNECQYCGIKCTNAGASIDHIRPRCKGGRTTWDNVVLACHRCNRAKGDKLLSHSGLSLIRPPTTPTWKELLGENPIDAASDWLPYLNGREEDLIAFASAL